MQGQMYQLMKQIAEKMLLQSERSLDLLSGLVVILGWYHYHCFVHAQMHNLVSLAMSLVAELGLKRRPSWQERTKLMVANLGDLEERTNGERRLLLAVWYISSWYIDSSPKRPTVRILTNCSLSVSLTFQQLDTMRYSPYMEQCLSELETAKEHESDAYLVHAIRIQKFTEKVAQIKMEDTTDDGVQSMVKAPLSGYVSAFQAELDGLRSKIPLNIRDNRKGYSLSNWPYGFVLTTHRPYQSAFKHCRPSIVRTALPQPNSSHCNFELPHHCSSCLGVFLST
jgi:hypothetical protein